MVVLGWYIGDGDIMGDDPLHSSLSSVGVNGVEVDVVYAI